MRKLALAGAATIALLSAGPAAAAPTGDFDGPLIDVVFVLDTTGSMAGLIEGAKRKIWSIAGEILETREQARVRFGLIGFRDRGDQYVTRNFDLTDDINGIYTHLLAFNADGGGDRPESVNQALNEAVTQMSWTPEDNALRIVFLVGDSPPHMDYQDDVKYPRSLQLARQRDIIVNTVLAGGASDTGDVWRRIAQQGGGEFMGIPQDGGMQTVVSPYDDRIHSLQQRLNDTVVPYGTREEQGYLENQLDEARAAPAPVSSDMAYTRMNAGSMNRVLTGGNDLVEDFENGDVDLDDVPVDELPENYRGLGAEELRDEIQRQVDDRTTLNTELAGLLVEREAWMDEETQRRIAEGGEVDAFDVEVTSVIRAQARERGIEYED